MSEDKMVLNYDDLTHPLIKNRIVLDYPFDVMLNRDCQLQDYEKGIMNALQEYNIERDRLWCLCQNDSTLKKAVFEVVNSKGWKNCGYTVSALSSKTDALLQKYTSVIKQAKGKVGSLLMRTVKDEYNITSDNLTTEQIGSGNLLIKGRPGSGKSTLALQMAVACTYSPNHYSAIYISFEESLPNIMLKAQSFNWREKLSEIQFLDTIDDTSAPEEIGKALKRMLTQPDGCFLRTLKEDEKECEKHNKRISKDVNNERFLIEPKVYLPRLSPRGLFAANTSHDELFWERYKQIERLLSGIEALRKENGFKILPDIRMVCIDSLNVFGEKPLSRNELFRLFDLFKSKGVIGVFTAEQDSELTDLPVGERIEDYLADIIIQLHMEEDNGYANRYFEVSKSRYQHQIYGMHPMRMRGLETQNQFRKDWELADILSEKIGVKELIKIDKNNLHRIQVDKFIAKLQDKAIQQQRMDELFPRIKAYYYSNKIYYTDYFSDNNAEQNIKREIKHLLTAKNLFFQPVTIHPSLHYIVCSTEIQSLSNDDQQRNGDHQREDGFDIGIEKLERYLKFSLKKGSVVTLRGPRATYKTNIAHHFLLTGIEKNENVLLITFNERSSVELDGENKIQWMRDDKNAKKTPKIFTEIKHLSLNDPKRIMKVFCTAENLYLTELTLKGGALLPEELMEFVRDILREKKSGNKITRVVLDDVAFMGLSYPFLLNSKTSGNLFLSAFVHVMKNYFVNLLITGTTGQMKESDEIVDRACELADSVLTTDFCNVFGDRYVIISGDGMHSSSSSPNNLNESEVTDFVPAVIKVHNKVNDKDTPQGAEDNKVNAFEINTELLQGLVGFGTSHIYRPGLRLYTFEEGRILHDYNTQLKAMLSSSLGISWKAMGVERETTKNINPLEQTSGKYLDISVVSFDSTMSAALHDSLDLVRESPLDSTVVYTIDDYWLPKIDDIYRKDSKIQQAFYTLPQDIRAEHKCKYIESAQKAQDNNSSKVKGDKASGQNKKNSNVPVEKIISEHFVPYYNNVILIAYNTDVLKELGMEDVFSNKETTWEDINRVIKKEYKPDLRSDEIANVSCHIHGMLAEPIKQPNVPCCIDTTAQETIACILLDAFGELFFDSIFPKNMNNNNKIKEIISQLKNLQPILQSAHECRAPRPHEDVEFDILSDNAAIYICWYSQLRELIRKKPVLSGKLIVKPLPNKGVRGDWYLGVAKGSVSLEMGKRAIRILNSKHEQFKRFSQGVGLPTLNEFNAAGTIQKFKNLGEAFDIQKIMHIHEYARTRQSIKNYKLYRQILYSIGYLLINKEKVVKDTTSDDAFYEDLFNIINDQCKIMSNQGS